MSRTLLVGLDAACWEYLNPLLAAGRLPVLARLLAAGAWGTLESTMPPWTPAAWASIITGKNPGQHGVVDMVWRRPNDYAQTPITARSRAGTPFWETLNASGVRVGLVNLPFTYPCDPLDGFFLAGFGTPPTASDWAYPPAARAWIEQTFGQYQPDIPGADFKAMPPREVLRLERAHQARQAAMAVGLAERWPVDVLAINLMLPDHANHKMPLMPLVEEAYCHSDADLGGLIEGFRPDNVMVISDHGSSRPKGDFLLGEWLRDHGYAAEVPAAPAEQSAALNWILVQLLQRRYGLAGPVEKVVRRLWRQAALTGPAWLAGWLWAHIEQAVPYARDYVGRSARVNYAATRVLPGSMYAGLLYFNVAGREPQGIVPPGQTAALASELAERLAEVRDPDTDKPLFRRIYTPAELYAGPALQAMPDLILDRADTGWNIHTARFVPAPGPRRGRYFVDSAQRQEFGWHSRQGMFVFAGPAFAPGAAPGHCHVMDIPATLLHLHGAAVPDDYDGRVLLEVLSADHRQRPVRQQAASAARPAPAVVGLSAGEAREVADRLRALGYLD